MPPTWSPPVSALVALLHGFVVQRVALGLTDVDGFLAAVRVLLRPT